MAKYRPLSSVLIKPTGPDCNLDCTYCFYLEKSVLFQQTPVHRMSPEIQEELIRQVMQQSGESVSLARQGGESTMADVPKTASKILQITANQGFVSPPKCSLSTRILS